MADVRVTVEDLSTAGIDLTDTGSLSASNTYLVNNDGNVFLHFKKSGAGACTVTVETPGTVGGQGIADLTFSVPATTGDVHVGPFPPYLFNDSNNDLNVTLSEITGLTIAAARLPRP